MLPANRTTTLITHKHICASHHECPMAGCGWHAPRSARPRHIMGLPRCPKLLHSYLLRFCVQGLCHGTIVEPSLFHWQFAAGIGRPAVASCRHTAHALSFVRLRRGLSSPAAGFDFPSPVAGIDCPLQRQVSLSAVESIHTSAGSVVFHAESRGPTLLSPGGCDIW